MTRPDTWEVIGGWLVLLSAITAITLWAFDVIQIDKACLRPSWTWLRIAIALALVIPQWLVFANPAPSLAEFGVRDDPAIVFDWVRIYLVVGVLCALQWWRPILHPVGFSLLIWMPAFFFTALASNVSSHQIGRYVPCFEAISLAWSHGLMFTLWYAFKRIRRGRPTTRCS
jgi:hypothetical protein